MIKKKNSVNITTITRKIEVVPIIHIDAMNELENISDKVELKKLRKKWKKIKKKTQKNWVVHMSVEKLVSKLRSH